MAKRSMFVGLDVNKDSIDISLAEGGRDGEVRYEGVVRGDLEAVAKVVRAPRVGVPKTSRPTPKTDWTTAKMNTTRHRTRTQPSA